MANQGAQLILKGPGGRRSVPITVVDGDGSNATFDNLNGASVWTADANYQVVDLIGEGTTAPTTPNLLQPNVNGTDVQGFFDLAAAYSADSDQTRRTGALIGGVIKQGSNLQLIARA